ncbi:DUF2125 domain-containing protein [Chelativorans sp. Marseille-P2723]|uniref:DUF2125 domain-containing protein n=1 Tax=Chelativorans sp. Marseille-P2723 TaxID=2709133 RepID=UPI00156EA091|nr:DUF2125 domain-containing protein [Chelativorans sp. Marseille-P2723]
MASRTQTGSRFSRRILWLAAAIIVAVLAYTGLWHYAANMLERRAALSVAAINGDGVRAHCEEPEARGFPFRIGIFCRSVFYENVRSGISFRAGTLRSAANVYRPRRVLGELDGPATIQLPFVLPLTVSWDSLRGSTRLASRLPESIALEGRNVELAPLEGGSLIAVLASAMLHSRQKENDLETAFSFQGLMLSEGVIPDVPPLEGRVLAVVNGGISLFRGESLDVKGHSALVKEMVVGLVGEDAALALSGPISISFDGLIDADLTIRMQDAGKLAVILAKLFPSVGSEVAKMATAFDDVPIQLKIVRGRVFAGFMPLGRIPPI